MTSSKKTSCQKKNPAKHIKYIALNIQSIAAELSSIYLQCSSTEISHAGKQYKAILHPL